MTATSYARDVVQHLNFRMFGLFKRKEKPIQITNEFIGVMTFVPKSDNEDSYWIGAKKFKPIGQTVEFLIYNDIDGPLGKQFDLCNDIEERYLVLTPLTDNLVQENFKDSNFRIGENLELSFVTIPRTPLDMSDFSMTFELTETFGFLEVDYKNWEPVHASFSA